MPILVLAYSNRELTDFMAENDTTLLDGLFLWQGDARILMAMVKYVEDRLNVAHDTGELGVPDDHRRRGQCSLLLVVPAGDLRRGASSTCRGCCPRT